MIEHALAHVVAGLLVLRSGIAQSHHHVGHAGPAPLLLLLGLLFVAAALLGVLGRRGFFLRLALREDLGFRGHGAQAGATTSSAIGAATVTTAWPGSFKIRTPGGTCRAATVRTSPIINAVTSASIRSGICVGRQETSSSCRTTFRMPFCSFTPAASPTG